MKFLEDYLKDKCSGCNICCRFPQKYSPLIPFFLNNEIKDPEYFPCIGTYYGCRINAIESGSGYSCPYFLHNKNKCSIYKNRPIDCRLYPFMITYDSSYKKVILVLDNNCPYSKELNRYTGEVNRFIDIIKLTQQNLGIINDCQPNTIFIEGLSKLTEFIFGKSGKFEKLKLEDRIIIPYLWNDIINLLLEKETQEVYYGINGNLRQFTKENKEYIYLKKDLMELKGDKYKDKRNLCNYFQKNYSYRIEKISPSPEKVDEYLSLYKKWANDKIEKNKNTYYNNLLEDSFFFHRRAFIDFNKLGLIGIEIKINNKLAGYTFGCEIKDDIFYILGEITDLNYKGINQFIFREFCRIIPEKYIYINTMDDSEIEGLRKNKLSYHPILSPLIGERI